MKTNHSALLVLFLSTSVVQAQESIKPPHPISSFGIATKVMSKLVTYSHYKIIGSCVWVVGKLPPKLVPVPVVEQFLPDLIVTVANRPETNPWIEANALFENQASQALYQHTYKMATDSELGFGDDAGQTNSIHINDERTRIVDVIVSPAGLYFPNYLPITIH